MLDLSLDRRGTPPRDAATLVLVRDGSGDLEVFCVQRHAKSAFLGGAIVFPGGKVDDADLDESWADHATPPVASSFASTAAELRGLGVAACREALEEAAILPLAKQAVSHDALVALRARAKETSLLACVRERGMRLDLGALRPLARWITPAAEARRFDARFFIAAAPPGQPGAHDDRETTASFWATPRETLGRFERGALQLAPPTHRMLEILARAKTSDDALRGATRANLDPICPLLVRHVDGPLETLALVLPGDPEHEVEQPRIAGTSRYILSGERWLPGSAPAGVRRAPR